MSKKIKEIMERELVGRYGEVTQCMLVSLHGLSGNQNNELRGDLKNHDIRMNVVKNSLARRAFGSLGQGAIGKLFEGPCAVVYGGDNVVDVAKIVAEWAKKLDKLVIKGALLDGEALDEAAAVKLATMPTRRELQGMVTGAAMSPGANLASAVGSPASGIAGCVEALVKRLEEAA